MVLSGGPQAHYAARHRRVVRRRWLRELDQSRVRGVLRRGPRRKVGSALAAHRTPNIALAAPIFYGLRTLLVSVDGGGRSAYAMTPHGRGSGAGTAPPPAFNAAV